jgi:beta-galactosidase
MIAAGFGLLDRTGAIKPMAYERMSWWSTTPVVNVIRRTSPSKPVPEDPGFVPIMDRQSQFADWSPIDRDPHEETVEAYSNCEEVDLLLNGMSLGKRPRNADDSPRIWKTKWEPGILTAIGTNHGAIVATYELRTAGKPAKIVLTADRASLTPSWDDVVFVTATVADRNGILIPDATGLVSFGITGPGIIAAVDNGDNSSAESFQASARKAYQGRCLAIIRGVATRGKITITASSPGLKGASIVLTCGSQLARVKR